MFKIFFSNKASGYSGLINIILSILAAVALRSFPKETKVTVSDNIGYVLKYAKPAETAERNQTEAIGNDEEDEAIGDDEEDGAIGDDEEGDDGEDDDAEKTQNRGSDGNESTDESSDAESSNE